MQAWMKRAVGCCSFCVRVQPLGNHADRALDGCSFRYAIPGAGATLEATDAALREQAEALAHDGPSAVELERIRKVGLRLVWDA